MYKYLILINILTLWIQFLFTCFLFIDKISAERKCLEILFLYSRFPVARISTAPVLSRWKAKQRKKQAFNTHYYTCLEAFAATRFNDIFSVRQSRQGVKVSQRFKDWLCPYLQGESQSLKCWEIFTRWTGCLPEKILLNANYYLISRLYRTKSIYQIST